MSVIRNAKIEGFALLTSTGELIVEKEKNQFPDLFDEACENSFQEGFEKGKVFGYEKSSSEMNVMLTLLQTLTRKLLEHKEKLLDELKPEIIEFCKTLCEKLIRRELSHPESFVKLVNSLLSFASASLNQEVVDIIVTPDDLILLESHLTLLQKPLNEIKDIRFKTDPLMKRGDVKIETKTHLLNYDISRELSHLQSKVLKVT